MVRTYCTEYFTVELQDMPLTHGSLKAVFRARWPRSIEASQHVPLVPPAGMATAAFALFHSHTRLLSDRDEMDAVYARRTRTPATRQAATKKPATHNLLACVCPYGQRGSSAGCSKTRNRLVGFLCQAQLVAERSACSASGVVNIAALAS